MTRLAAPMPAHAALLEHLLHVAHHVRITAQHRVRVLRRQWHARPRLEPAVANGIRDTSRECILVRFPADEGSERKAARMSRGDAGDHVVIRQVGGVPHRVDQHDALEFLPRLFGAQYR